MMFWKSAIAAGIGLLLALPAHAQPPMPRKGSGLQLFGNLTVTPTQLPQEHTLFGISGGRVETQSLSGIKESETGICIGFVDSTPDHLLTLTDNFKFLRLQIRSSGDTVMLVKGPGGAWCSDDVGDRNPIIAGGWLRGTYRIWIGSYEPNASFPYVLEVGSDEDGLVK